MVRTLLGDARVEPTDEAVSGVLTALAAAAETRDEPLDEDEARELVWDR